jgi:hypothetical protein
VELQKNRQERLSILLAKPEQVEEQDISLLEDLARQYPFFEPLHLLLAKANPEKPTALTAATLHANGALLHKVLQHREPLADVDYLLPLSDKHHEEERPLEEDKSAVVNEKTDTIEDAFVLESISSSDFFAFEQRFVAEETKEDIKEEIKAEVTLAVEVAEKKPEDPVSVTNYDDDTLPYTFLWWLAKTRKEHQSIFQPYATVRKNKGGELQQQYVEHIFHIQSPFNAEEVINNTPESKHVDPKETAIIENFLKKDPQISPPKPEQIDNENKAKKSAEDHNDLVSETLAKIYIEQMLYHKAIETYQKLSLKFPEKSRYFADLIQSLEKKI